MNTTALGIYAVLVLVPALPLLLTWRQALARRDSLAVSSLVTVKLPLAVITASCLMFFLNLLVQPSTGVRYSDARFRMIVSAFGVSLVMVALSVAGRNPFRWLLTAAATGVAVVWLYLWAMSAVV